MLFRVLLLVYCVCKSTNGENFPSLLTTNASVVIVIDKDYLGDEYEKVKTRLEDYLVYAKREILRHGGIQIQFYSWSAINVKRDLTAIISMAACSDTWKLFRSAESENLLHMAISEKDCPRLPQNQAITVPIIERGQETPQILLDLRTTGVYKWRNMIIIYDNTIDDDLLTRIIKSVTKPANRIETSGVSLLKLLTNSSFSADDVRSNLKEKLSTIDPKAVGGNFLVIVSSELVEIMMGYAKDLGLVDTQNQWLYVISDTDSRVQDLRGLRKLLKEGDNVAFIYNTTVVNKVCVGGIVCQIEELLAGFTKSLDEAIVDEYEIAAQVSEEEWEAIRPTKSERKKYLLDKIKKHQLNFGTCDNCTKWRLETGETWGREYQKQTDFFKPDFGIAKLLSVGTWRPSDGPSMTDELFPHIAHGFRGKKLPLISIHNPPWQILKTNESGDVIEYSGIAFSIIKELSKSLNFTYSVETVKNILQDHLTNPTTNESSNYTYFDKINLEKTTYRIPKEIIQLVHNKSYALGACAFTVSEEYKKLINFTNPISIQFYTFLVARPRELSRALLFISPFRSDTWLCLSATIISMGPILYYIHKSSPVYEYKGDRSKGGLATVQNCIWYMYGALLQQGGMHLPYADSARIIVGAWWLVVLVIGTTYCGNLVAFLTFPKIDIPITTIEEMIAHKDSITWSYAKNTFLEARIKDTRDNSYKMIYEKRKEIPNKKTMIDKIKAGKHVYFDWKIKLQYMMKQQYLETDTCDLALGTDEFFDEQLALIVAPDTPYLKKINAEIKKLHQVGLIQKWLEDYLPKKDRCWKKKRSIEVNNHTVNMDDMQGSFFILFFGFFLAAAVIVIESFWFRKIRSKKAKKVVQPFIT